MAYVPSAVAPRDFIVESPTGTRPGFFRRFVDVVMLARQRQADREIARYLQNNKFTDEAEREIERLFLSTPTRF
jgi:hypothetical protein